MSNAKDTLTRVTDMDLTRGDPPAPVLALARQYSLASPKAFLFPFFFLKRQKLISHMSLYTPWVCHYWQSNCCQTLF